MNALICVYTDHSNGTGGIYLKLQFNSLYVYDSNPHTNEGILSLPSYNSLSFLLYSMYVENSYHIFHLASY